MRAVRKRVPTEIDRSTREDIAISRKGFIIALGVFAAAYLWLVALIGHWGMERSPAIGGGSYNLDKFVYSALILLLAGSSSFFALVLGLARQDRALSRRAFVFSGVALVAFLASYFAFGDNFS